MLPFNRPAALPPITCSGNRWVPYPSYGDRSFDARFLTRSHRARPYSCSDSVKGWTVHSSLLIFIGPATTYTTSRRVPINQSRNHRFSPYHVFSCFRVFVCFRVLGRLTPLCFRVFVFWARWLVPGSVLCVLGPSASGPSHSAVCQAAVLGSCRAPVGPLSYYLSDPLSHTHTTAYSYYSFFFFMEPTILLSFLLRV